MNHSCVIGEKRSFDACVEFKTLSGFHLNLKFSPTNLRAQSQAVAS